MAGSNEITPIKKKAQSNFLVSHNDLITIALKVMGIHNLYFYFASLIIACRVRVACNVRGRKKTALYLVGLPYAAQWDP